MWPFRPGPGQTTGPTGDDSTSPAGVASSSGELGRRGEKLAAKHLKKGGMKVLARNYRCPVGEADLIALEKTTDCETIVFVEVKTRSSDKSVAPESAVNFAKQQKLRGIAKYYLASHNTADRPIRFDVVSIVIPPGGKPNIRHIPNAF